MYSSIMVPVDLAHTKALEKALATAADLAKAYGASLTYVGVTTNTPGPLAHDPKEFGAKLDAFVAAETAARDVEGAGLVVTSHDPSANLNKDLLEAARQTGADLVVMGSHMPGLSDHIFTGHAPYVATHAPVSVLVVR
ncbi:hypothetical protein LNKW23_11490 [Paralimibaculum aggregatum]|uniref:UspA domain-containing protein n=1 Tax=Paralimibaculum aggregatum TaxID=3036245 RepID=A0ABQ6LND2_9RHOB|nr:universal stress protein [Limibaculum sp. NKW23]GMG81936.1 hypothetical protein LNKW23_11490 [Limibaculum sp. NKW23]